MEIQTILVFDVETTGLLPRLCAKRKLNSENTENPPEENLDDLPYITQLSFILYDIIQNKIIKSYDSYIRIEPHIKVPEKVTEITGITSELLNEKGKDIVVGLTELYAAYCQCDVVVAHNFEFDSRMVQLELKRNYEKIRADIRPHICWMFNPMYCKVTYVMLHCTMKSNTALCNIKHKTAYGKEFTKFPKLSELYEFLFHSVPENLHNSMIDVLACLRCYLKTEFNIDITDKIFQSLIESYAFPSLPLSLSQPLPQPLPLSHDPVLSQPLSHPLPMSQLQLEC